MMIYFDRNKEAYADRYDGLETIASVSAEIWSIYAGDKAGTTWDIVNGNFVQLKDMNVIKRERKVAERSDERAGLLADADLLLAKATDYIGTEYDAAGMYTNLAIAIKQYKIDVRTTIYQLDFPFSVVYPPIPDPVPTPGL